MSVRLRRMLRWASAGALLFGLGACAGPPPGPTGPTYSCCVAADIERIYHPGDTLTIHWIVQGPPAPSGAAHQIELSARLSGAFGNVAGIDLHGVSAQASSMAHDSVPDEPAGTNRATIRQ